MRQYDPVCCGCKRAAANRTFVRALAAQCFGFMGFQPHTLRYTMMTQTSLNRWVQAVAAFARPPNG